MKKVKLLLLFLLILTLVGCSNNTPSKSEKLVYKEHMIMITLDSVEDLKFDENSKVIFKLWGYDQTNQIKKAKLLRTYNYGIINFPATYGLDHQKEWNEKLISNPNDKYRYYITLEVVGAKGKKYKIDYKATPKNYFEKKREDIKELSGKIYIKL